MKSIFSYLRNQKGLTLIELIVSAVIGGLLLYGLFIVYADTIRIWKEEEARYVMIRDIMRVESELRRDLDSAFEVYHDNGFGGHATMALASHHIPGYTDPVINRFFLFQGMFVKDGIFKVFGRDESESDYAEFRFYPLISPTTSPGQGVVVVSVEFHTENATNHRMLEYDITVENKYEDQYRLYGWIKCYGRG
ncbi:MAG: type II secretion system protein [candidate division Zixibacteria bacterium]|nr:type II secretion system protein [candidate division Zixibacteria bacterium]